MSVSIIQNVAGTNNFGAATEFTAFGSNNASGNTIVALLYFTPTDGSAPLTPSFSDTKGNSYSIISSTFKNTPGSFSGLNIGCLIAYATGIAAGANTVTVTFSGPSNYAILCLFELSPCTLDKATGAISATVTANPSAGSLSLSGTGEFAAAIAVVDDGVGSPGLFTAGTGWTIQLNNGGGADSEGTEYRVGASGTITGDFVKGSGNWVAAVAAFSDNSGATPFIDECSPIQFGFQNSPIL